MQTAKFRPFRAAVSNRPVSGDWRLNPRLSPVNDNRLQLVTCSFQLWPLQPPRPADYTRKMKLKLKACLFVLAFGVSGCSGSSSTTGPSATSNLPFSTVDLRVGTGAEATVGKAVTVNYTGWLYNSLGQDFKGTLFDSSLAAGATPLPFTVGSSGIIPGFSQCVLGMKVSGLRRCTIPPALAYGSQGRAPIPANATLIFELELLTVQ
jgi:FKBP-type peptidyl-prolyl cis-trans isomerase FkpA